LSVAAIKEDHWLAVLLPRDATTKLSPKVIIYTIFKEDSTIPPLQSMVKVACTDCVLGLWYHK
jgi:hypothetical protein